jgi:hypothetical protein
MLHSYAHHGSIFVSYGWRNAKLITLGLETVYVRVKLTIFPRLSVEGENKILCFILFLYTPKFVKKQPKSDLLYNRRSTASQSWRQAHWDPGPEFLFSNWTLASLCNILSDERTGLSFTVAAVIIASQSHGTDDHILLSQMRVSPNLEGQVPIFTSPPGTGGALLHLQALDSLFVASYDSQGYGGCTRPWGHKGSDRQTDV